jgi:hypothetical protein
VMRNAYKILAAKHEIKRTLGKSRRKCEDNIKMDLGELGWNRMNWIHLADNRNRYRIL